MQPNLTRANYQLPVPNLSRLPDLSIVSTGRFRNLLKIPQDPTKVILDPLLLKDNAMRVTPVSVKDPNTTKTTPILRDPPDMHMTENSTQKTSFN